MSNESSNPDESAGQAQADAPREPGTELAVVGQSAPAGEGAVVTAGQMPARQISQLPTDEMEHLAEDLGIDPTRYRTPQQLVAAVHERRQLIAGLNREAMLDVVRWGRRPVTINATREDIAREITRIHSMAFSGLSQRGLCVLAQLRGLEIRGDEGVPIIVRRLKKQEGFFSRMNRKRRSMLGSIVASIVGDNRSASDYQFLPPGPAGESPSPQPARPASIKEEIEESGLFGGISNRIKKTADQYLNQKLDEIEARIDRKLEEIDRRLAEWRDKEIANRIRILKITLWASVIVGIFSLIYTYVKAYVRF